MQYAGQAASVIATNMVFSCIKKYVIRSCNIQAGGLWSGAPQPKQVCRQSRQPLGMSTLGSQVMVCGM